MKKLLIATLTATILSACATTEPTTPTQTQSLNATADKVLAKIKHPAARTIAYFDADGQLTPKATAGGYYRKLLGHTAEGYAVVQDFYQDSQTKQTNAIIIPDEANIDSFNVIVTEGRTIWYTPKGDAVQFVDVHAGKTIMRGNYLNGRLALEEKMLPETKGSEATLFDSDGKIITRIRQNSPAADITIQFFDTTGKLVLETTTNTLPQPGDTNFEAIQTIFERANKIMQQIKQNRI